MMYDIFAFLVVGLIVLTLAIIILAPFVIGLLFLIAGIDLRVDTQKHKRK